MAAFARQEAGTDVPLEAIARAAGVGIGTLYRHFPTRDALVLAAYQHEVDDLCAAADDLRRALAPDQALAEWMARFVDYVAAKRGMADALRATAPSPAPPSASGAELPMAARDRIVAALGDLLDAAAAAGSIRNDLSAGDVWWAMSGVWSASTEPDWQDQARRLLGLLMDGLRHRGPDGAEASVG